MLIKTKLEQEKNIPFIFNIQFDKKLHLMQEKKPSKYNWSFFYKKVYEIQFGTRCVSCFYLFIESVYIILLCMRNTRLVQIRLQQFFLYINKNKTFKSVRSSWIWNGHIFVRKMSDMLLNATNICENKSNLNTRTNYDLQILHFKSKSNKSIWGKRKLFLLALRKLLG